MQLKGEASKARNEALGALSLKTTVAASGVSMAATSPNRSLRTEITPSGGLAMRPNVALISCDESGEPSWNLTPSWSLKAYASPSGDMVQLVAKSPTTCGFSVASHFTSKE